MVQKLKKSWKNAEVAPQRLKMKPKRVQKRPKRVQEWFRSQNGAKRGSKTNPRRSRLLVGGRGGTLSIQNSMVSFIPYIPAAFFEERARPDLQASPLPPAPHQDWRLRNIGIMMLRISQCNWLPGHRNCLSGYHNWLSGHQNWLSGNQNWSSRHHN